MLPRFKQTLIASAALAAPLLLTACGETMQIASHAPLTTVDPVATTAYVARSHGYLVYDTLFAMDESFQPQPQMVETWDVSDDGLTWRFTLRDGLAWHDGTPVTAADSVASLERWGKRDGKGQQLFRLVESLEARDDKTFVMTLSQPYDEVLQAFAKVSANVPFIMPKAVAETDPWAEIQDTTGSGPFIYQAEESRPGKAVYVRNPDYRPRSEPQSLAAGAKVAELDRIEWIYYPEQRDAVQALIDGEVDYVESPATRLVSMMEGKEDVIVASTDPLGNVAMARFNHRIPPFDKAEVRRAVLMAMQQEDYMTAALQDPRYWRTCYSVYPCGTPLAEEDPEGIMQMADRAAARAALEAAGYDGTPVVVLKPVDTPVMAALTDVTTDLLRDIGMTVEVEEMSWTALLERRQNRGPVAQGGWNLFHTWWIAADLLDPTAIAFSGDPETGWIGWAEDARLEELRAAFSESEAPEARREIAAQVQQRLWEIGAFGVLGQFFEPVAFRANVEGITSPMQFYWGVSLGG